MKVKVHELKCWPGSFEALWTGRKRYELRKADRPFEVGDVLHIREWSPVTKDYTSAELVMPITYMTQPGEWGLPNDLCVLGLGEACIRSDEEPEGHR